MIGLPHRIRVATGLVALLVAAALSGCGFHGANSFKLPGTKGGGAGCVHRPSADARCAKPRTEFPRPTSTMSLSAP